MSPGKEDLFSTWGLLIAVVVSLLIPLSAKHAKSKDLQQLVYMVPAAVVGSLLGALGMVCILWCFWMSRRSRKFPGTFSKHGVGGADGKNCESTDHTYEDMDRKGRSDSSLEQSMKFKLAAIDTHVPITSSLSGSDVMATASSERPHQPLEGHTSDKTPSEACTSSNQLPVDVPDGYSLLGKETPEVEINNNNVSKSDDGYVGDEYVGDESVGDNQYEMDNYEYVCPEPYFEPANEEETLVMQLNTKLAMTEIRREDLEFGAILGSGEFGTVYRGVWSHCKADSNQIVKEEVAVKTIEHQYSEKDKVKFLQEAAIMAQFKHDNIVGIKGVLTKPPTMMIVLDLLEGGDLRQYLLTTMRSRLSSLDPAELGSMLLSYMRQISVGLLCLIMKSYIHRDLAARNILVSKDGTVCKIADFGLSRDLHMENSYVSHGGKVPVKWTAPEAIHYRKYSPASDVWSLGCVIYEIWSLGHKPFQEQSNSEAMKYIASGRRLHPPPGCPKAVYNIMIKCWNPTPDERPLICRLIQELQRSDFQLLKWSADDVNVYSKETRTIGAPLNLGKELFEELQNTYLK